LNTFKSKKANEDVRCEVKNRRHEITNDEKIADFPNQMAT
jgi:hypothetical protein